MFNKILTVSIAAYNMEAYLHRTLDSLIDKRVIDDLEVFVVDDGSTDHTLEIAGEYAARYPDSIFAVHKENGGYGTTVNYSIAHATGKYFKLLDGDDWFDTEELVKLIAELRKIQDDLIFLPYKCVYESGGEEYISAVASEDNIESGNRFILDEAKKTPGAQSIAYRTEVLKRSGLTLPSHRLFTDGLFSSVPIAFCETARYFDICVYCYRIGREGQSVERSSIIQHAFDLRLLIEDQLAFYGRAKRKELRNLVYLKHQFESEYVACLKPYLYAPTSKKMLEGFKEYEKNVGAICPEISDIEDIHGRKPFFIKLCRKTNYAAYWLLKFIPKGTFMVYKKLLSNKIIRKVNSGGVTGHKPYCPVIACRAGAAA